MFVMLRLLVFVASIESLHMPCHFQTWCFTPSFQYRLYDEVGIGDGVWKAEVIYSPHNCGRPPPGFPCKTGEIPIDSAFAPSRKLCSIS
jgi:hypothetical protein